RQTLVVRPDETCVVDPGERPMLTLTACHPPYSARYRLAVQADLVEVQPTDSEPEAGSQ
ncbi:sortase, partial [bacterium]|nr:sortase [bacterium]